MKIIINGTCIVCGSKDIIQECFYKHSDNSPAADPNPCRSGSQYRCEKHRVSITENSLFTHTENL